jgi:hypothetical protein
VRGQGDALPTIMARLEAANSTGALWQPVKMCRHNRVEKRAALTQRAKKSLFQRKTGTSGLEKSFPIWGEPDESG